MRKLIEIYSNQWNEHGIQIKYKRAVFLVDMESLEAYQQEQLRTHDCEKFTIHGNCVMEGKTFKEFTFFFHGGDKPVQLATYEMKPTTYINYAYGDLKDSQIVKVQRNGFMVYCAPTGQGKTFFALRNLVALSSQSDIILYINLELSIDDIKGRCEHMGIKIPNNVYVAPLETVSAIESWVEGKGSATFIIDNIDNLVGGGLDPFGAQLDFIKDLDRFLKDEGHHALVLTQLVKENNTQIIAKDGEINDAITTNILSGVKQLSYLSRSVMMTAWSPELSKYVYKMLKVGSAIL